MKKKSLMLALLAGAALSGFAQSKSSTCNISLGIEAGLPVGTAKDVSTYTIGGSLKYEHLLTTQTWLTLSGGYTYFPYKNDITINNVGYASTNSGEGFIPLKAGIKYFISDMFYAEGQLGASISTDGGSTGFAYAPGIGYKFDRKADLGVRYEGWSRSSGNTISQIAVRIAYSF